MTVADIYPSVTDTNGTTWFRPEGKPSQMWGWTSDPHQAHPSYQTVPLRSDPTRKETPQVTVLDHRGAPDTARYSEFMRYPLPPLLPREEVQFDGYGRYKLPSPTTGRPTSYTRATTVSSTTSDHFNLTQWKIRTKVAAVLRAQRISEEVKAGGGDQFSDNELAMGVAFNQLQQAFANESNRDINNAIDLIDDLGGGRDAAELGGAVHDWLGELDMGRVLLHQIPEMFQPYAIAYQEALQRAGLVAIPDYVERVVLNTLGEETIAGRIDRMYFSPETVETYLGDVKTSKSLDFALMEYAIQFAIYGYAPLMLGLDGMSWEPMPEINKEFCVCVHVPSNQPERSQVVPFDLYAGGEGVVTAIEVRQQRKELPKRVLGHTTPIPSARTLRYVAARQELQNMASADDAVAIKEAFEDVWDDSLDEFGATCFELLTATTTEEN